MSNDTITIEQMNREICDFMGWVHSKDENMDRLEMNGLKYHTSWDWLKPVIDEIFKYALAHRDEVQKIIDISVVVDISAAHEKVYQFIQWLNQNKNQ